MSLFIINMNRVKYLFLLTCCILSLLSNAQDDKDFHPPNMEPPPVNDKQIDDPNAVQTKGFDKRKLFTGGNIGLQFGTLTVIEVSPLLGYQFTKRFAAGIGGNYLFVNGTVNDPNGYYYYDHESIIGGRIFSRFSIIEQLFIHGEYEMINYKATFWDYSTSSYKEQRVTVPGLLAGAGYSQMLGERSSWNILILFELLQNTYYPYANPIIRMNFNFGL
jgi:hypothetical protein